MDTQTKTVMGEGNAPRGWVYQTWQEISDACAEAKQETLRDARKQGWLSGTLFSFPNPYLLAMNENGRMNNEPWFFTRTPSKRDVRDVLKEYPTCDYIAAYFDLRAGSREDRLAGEMDEPTDMECRSHSVSEVIRS